MNRIMQIFYGEDFLPYKDKERVVHYPIVGNSFNGMSNVDQIRFYVKDIGGTLTLSWVAITKLPNGRIIYELLNTIGYDSECNEYYVSLSISNLYTQLKGDVYISLNGYRGEVEIETDQETGLQTISATLDSQTVMATGTIKLAINYAPQRPQGYSFDIDQYQNILNALGNKANTINTIQVVENINSLNASDYEIGQLFYNLSDNHYYIVINNNEKEFVQTVLDEKRFLQRYIITGSELVGSLVPMVGNRIVIFNTGGDGDYLGRISAYKITICDMNGEYYEREEGGNNFNFTFNSLVQLQYRYKYLKELKGIASAIYATGEGSAQTYLSYSKNALSNEIVQRDANGQIAVPLTPTSNNNATSKKYVDDLISSFKENELQVVDTNVYPTLEDFLEDDLYGEEGYIYLYPIDTSDLTKGYYRYIWENNDWLGLGTTEIDFSDYYTKNETNTLLGGKVDKTNQGEKVYGTDELGAQTNYSIDSYLVGDGEVVRRNSGTGTVVVGTPTSNTHATTKGYVDANFQLKLVSGTNIKSLNGKTLLGSGNISFINYIDHSMLSQDIGDNFESVNLFDKTKVVSGGYYNSSGVVSQREDSDYSTQYIRVKYGTYYRITSTMAYQYQICTYDKNGNFIERLAISTNPFTFGESVEFIRIGYYAHHFASSFMLCKDSDYPCPYSDYNLIPKIETSNIKDFKYGVVDVISKSNEQMSNITKTILPDYSIFHDNCYAGGSGAKTSDNNFASIEITALADFYIWVNTTSGYVSLCIYNTDNWNASYTIARYRNSDNNLPTSTNKLFVRKGRCIVLSYRKSDSDFNFYVDGLFKNLLLKKYISTNDIFVTKSGDNYAIKMGKYTFPFQKVTNNSTNLDSYDINSVLQNNVEIENGNILGVVKEYGQDDFMGGVQHGDDKVISMNIYCDGKPITESTNGKRVDAYLISNFQRVSDHTTNVIKRLVHIIFENNKMTIETTFRCLVDNFSCQFAYVGMWGQYTSQINAIYNNVDEYDTSNYQGKTFAKDLLKWTTYEIKEGLITINYDDGYKNETSFATYVYYSDSLRLKTYLGLAQGIVMNTGDELYGKSVYDFS